MKSPAAFRGTYSDWKLVKTRGVVQIVFEVPLADADAAYDLLGGMPDLSRERWFGIAALVSPTVKEESATPQPSYPRSAGAKQARDWRDLPYSQQAGIRINEPTFAAYLREEHAREWHATGDADTCLKLICGVDSKRELGISGKPATLWFQIDSAYQAWLAKEKVGA